MHSERPYPSSGDIGQLMTLSSEACSVVEYLPIEPDFVDESRHRVAWPIPDEKRHLSGAGIPTSSCHHHSAAHTQYSRSLCYDPTMQT